MAHLRALARDQRSLCSAATVTAAMVGATSRPDLSPFSSSQSARQLSTTPPACAARPTSRARQLLAPLRKGRRPRQAASADSRFAVAGSEDGASPEASTSQVVSAKRNAPLESLESLIATEGRVQTRYKHNLKEVTQSTRVWEAYLKIEDHSSITTETWRAIVQAVVPHAEAAANHRPKAWRNRKLTEYFMQGYDDRLERVLRDKVSVGLNPTEDDLLFMLEQFAVTGSVKRSEEVFQRLTDRGFVPSVQAFGHRLKAIQTWLWRYDSHEARVLIAKGDLMPRAQAVAHVPDLVSSIMVQVQASAFAAGLPDELVDQAGLIYARLGSWDRFNSLARWGYGVDLDVPDAIPQEWLDRIQDDDETALSRGMSPDGLEALLILCLNAGQPWRALSSFEIFAYDTITPAHLHPALSRRGAPTAESAENEEEVERAYLRYAPPLPPSSALALMNLHATPIAAPEEYAPEAEEAGGRATTVEVESEAPSKGVIYEVLESRRRFRPAAIAPNHRVFSILLDGLRDMAVQSRNGKSHVALYRHILTRALADGYQERQRVSSALLKLLSHSAEAADVRRAEMEALRPPLVTVRSHWFGNLRQIVAGEDARTQFEVLGWAEAEHRHWRLAIEMDYRIIDKAMNVLINDRTTAVASLKTPEGHPWRESEAETLRIATDYKHINIRSELQEVMWHRDNASADFRSLAEARVRAAWADLLEMHGLLEAGYPPAHELADGSTIGSRVDEYAGLLAERLNWELEPSSVPTQAGEDPLSVLGRFSAFARLMEQKSFSPAQLKPSSRLLQFPTAEAPNLLEVATEAYVPPMHPSFNARAAETVEAER